VSKKRKELGGTIFTHYHRKGGPAFESALMFGKKEREGEKEPGFPPPIRAGKNPNCLNSLKRAPNKKQKKENFFGLLLGGESSRTQT